MEVKPDAAKRRGTSIAAGKKEVRPEISLRVHSWLSHRAQRNGSTIRKQAEKILTDAMLKEMYDEGRITDRRQSQAA